VPKEWVVIGLLALAGFLIGGVYATWRTTKVVAAVLAAAALLAAGGAAAWFLS
jgi:hypothetical protein